MSVSDVKRLKTSFFILKKCLSKIPRAQCHTSRVKGGMRLNLSEIKQRHCSANELRFLDLCLEMCRYVTSKGKSQINVEYGNIQV